MRVLFVDDDGGVSILAKILRERHPDDMFESAFNLRRAVEAIWTNKYDALVFDIMLPPDEQSVPGSSLDGGVTSGVKLVDKIKSDETCKNRKTPIVLLTGLPSELHPDIEKAEKDYAGNYFQKPVMPDDLYLGILRALKKPAA